MVESCILRPDDSMNFVQFQIQEHSFPHHCLTETLIALPQIVGEVLNRRRRKVGRARRVVREVILRREVIRQRRRVMIAVSLCHL